MELSEIEDKYKNRLNLDKDNDINTTRKEKIDSHWQLRKKHNQNIIMTQRKKRILSMNATKISEPPPDENDQFDLLEEEFLNIDYPNQKYLLNEEDLLIKQPLLNNISNYIKLILDYLSVDDFEKNKWVIFTLRKYFENDNPPLGEYLVLFENNIHQYFEKLLNRYKNYEYIYIINEILFIITNFFDRNEIVNKYPKNYFKYFLTDSYMAVYNNFILSQDEEFINTVFYLLKNILLEQNDLILEILSKEYFFYNMIKIIQNKKYSIETIKNFVSFFLVIFEGIKNKEIMQVKLFYSILEVIFKIYLQIDSLAKKDAQIIKNVIVIFRNSLTCKAKDDTENDDYIAFNFLFNGNAKSDKKFPIYFCQTLNKNLQFYCSNNILLKECLDLLEKITYYSTHYQINTLLNIKLHDILNNILCYIYSLSNNTNDNNPSINISTVTTKILYISENIIDSGLECAKIFVYSKLFETLLIYFRDNMSNNNITFKFIDAFSRLLNYTDKEIADCLYKRGIIKDAVFDSLLSQNNRNYNREMLLKLCQIISKYLETMFEVGGQDNGFSNNDLILCYQFKEIVENVLEISMEDKECLCSLDYMSSVENLSK